MIAFTITVVLFLLLTYKQILSFFKKIHHRETFLHHDETTKKVTVLLLIDITTPRALLPYEKIKFNVVVKAINPSFIKFFKEQEVTLGFLAPGVSLSSIEPVFIADEEPIDSVITNWLRKHDSQNPISKFVPTGEENEYYTEIEVLFTKPGKFRPAIHFSSDTAPSVLPFELEIGSTVEVMNKRTNDLLYVLTIIGVLLTMYSLFANDLGGFIKSIGQKPANNSNPAPKRDTVGHVFKPLNK